MNASKTPFRQPPRPNCIRMLTYAFTPATPAAFVFSEHPIPLRGASPDDRFVSGAYGYRGEKASYRQAAAHAARTGMKLTTLRLFFRLRQYESVGVIVREVAERTGFLHLPRLQRHYREEIRHDVLGYLESTLDAVHFNALKTKTLDQIVLEHPAAAGVLLTLLPKIDLVVHPVMPNYADIEAESFDIATVRTSMAREMDVEVRFLEHIPATC